MALHNLLHVYETWEITEQDKFRMSGEMKFMRRTVKYTRQVYKTDKNILSELEIKPFVKKIQNYRSRCLQRTRRIDTDRPTDRL